MIKPQPPTVKDDKLNKKSKIKINQSYFNNFNFLFFIFNFSLTMDSI